MRAAKQDAIAARLPAASWTCSSTRASNSSPATASPCPPALPARRSTRRSRPPTRSATPCVVKAQVQIGGRGKAGGIKLAKDGDEAQRARRGHPRHGHPRLHRPRGVDREASDIEAELRGDHLRPRAKATLAMLSTQGGMDIEEVAERDPGAIAALTSPAPGLAGLPGPQARIQGRRRRRPRAPRHRLPRAGSTTRTSRRRRCSSRSTR